MDLETRCFASKTGWSSPLPAELDSEKTVVLAFGSPTLPATDPRVFGELRATFPRAQMLGCSTAGEIHDATIRDDSLVVAAFRFDRVTPRVVSASMSGSASSFEAGADIARRLAGPDLRAVFLLSEGLHVNGSELVRGINSVLPAAVPVTGGLAADGSDFRRTWVFDGESPVENRVVALGLFGDALRITHGSKGGWDIFGPERRVTRSEGNVLYELDGRPALRLYKDYLGDRASGLPATALLFPLAIRAEAGSTKQLVRTVLAVDEEQQSLTFAGDIPTGSLAQLMRANFDRLIQGASDAAARACDAAGEHAVLSIAISCVGRRLVLGERSEEEVEATLEALPPRTRQIGFYSYGEISPFTSGSCDLHNQTMTLTTISER